MCSASSHAVISVHNLMSEGRFFVVFFPTSQNGNTKPENSQEEKAGPILLAFAVPSKQQFHLFQRHHPRSCLALKSDSSQAPRVNSQVCIHLPFHLKVFLFTPDRELLSFISSATPVTPAYRLCFHLRYLLCHVPCPATPLFLLAALPACFCYTTLSSHAPRQSLRLPGSAASDPISPHWVRRSYRTAYTGQFQVN